MEKGEKSLLLCDPGSELRLLIGGRKKKKGEGNKWEREKIQKADLSLVSLLQSFFAASVSSSGLFHYRIKIFNHLPSSRYYSFGLVTCYSVHTWQRINTNMAKTKVGE